MTPLIFIVLIRTGIFTFLRYKTKATEKKDTLPLDVLKPGL